MGGWDDATQLGLGFTIIITIFHYKINKKSIVKKKSSP
jgi:hypothetical protein